MSTARPTEVKAIAALLTEGADSPEALAKAVIDKLDELRTDRPWFTVVSIMSDRWATGCGPFVTDNKARQALEQLKIPAAGLARVNAIVKTWSPRHAEQALERANQ